MLLGQTKWILRRTETVSFTAEGSTRRHIVFDCMLPSDDSKWLKWIPDGESEEYEPRYVGLPITYLGKGDLINLDVRDGDGSSLHTVGLKDDSRVVRHALENCIYALPDRNRLLYRLNVLALQEMESILFKCSSSQKLDFLSLYQKDLRKLGAQISLWCREYYRRELTGNDKNPKDESLFKYFLDGSGVKESGLRFHGNLILDTQEPDKYIDSSVKYAVMNNAYSMVLNSSWSGILRRQKSGEATGGCAEIVAFKGLDDEIRRAMYMPDFESAQRAVKQDFNIYDVAERKIDYIRKTLFSEILNEHENNDWKKFDELLESELDWSVRALLRLLRDWRNAHTQHAMEAKLSDGTRQKGSSDDNDLSPFLLLLTSVCDTYPLIVLVPIKDAKQQKRLLIKISFDAGYSRTSHREVGLRNLSMDQTIDLAFQTFGARSTHIEVAPAENAILTDVREIALTQPSANAMAKKNESHRLAARIAAGRLHVSTGSNEKWPLTRLRLTIMMQRNYIASFFLWSMLSFVLNLALGCMIGMWPWRGLVESHMISPQVLSLFSAQNVLAILAVVFTLWVARRISTMQHRIVEGLNSSMTAMLNIDLLISTELCLIACGGMTGSGDDITGGGWCPGWKIFSDLCCIVSFVILIIASISGVEYCRRIAKIDGSFRMRTEYQPVSDNQSEQNEQQRAIMPADQAAFSVLESYSEQERNHILMNVDRLPVFRRTKGKAAQDGHE